MIIKLLLTAIITALISSVLKNSAKEFLIPFQLISGTLFLIYILNESTGYFSDFQKIIEKYNDLYSVMKSMIKSGTVAIITKLSCDICHENGNYFIEDVVELGGRIMVFVITLPYISKVIDTAVAFID